MPRPRTTKGIAKRIELTYYRRPHPFRWWWRVLCIAVPAAGALWLLVMAVVGDQRLYTSGPVVLAHQMFDAACDRCHIQASRPAVVKAALAADGAARPTPGPARHEGGWFFRRVSDGACLQCHDGAIHHETQTHEPGCARCHIEHEGRTTLTRLSDAHCTGCHADLQRKPDAKPKFEIKARIVSFAPVKPEVDHPEFAVLRLQAKDRAKIKLNHATHLKEGLRGPSGAVTLGCTYCHVEDAAGRYMLPINFTKHCRECHQAALEVALGSDENIVAVPHERPEVIRGFLLRLALAAPAKAPAAPRGPAPPEEGGGGRRRPGGSSDLFRALDVVPAAFQEAPRAAGRLVLLAQRRRGGGEEEAPKEAPPAGAAPAAPAARGVPAAVAKAEQELFASPTGCAYCHTEIRKLDRTEAGEPPYQVARPEIPVRWLPHSRFDHRAHRAVECLACHPDARTSAETADVLMPRIATCRECHRPGGGAQAGCSECHLYHDPTKERAPDGLLTLPQLLGRKTAGAPPPPEPAKK